VLIHKMSFEFAGETKRELNVVQFELCCLHYVTRTFVVV